MRKLTYDEIAQQRFSPEPLKTQERLPIYLLLDNVRSLYNVGAIFRTADGARVSKIFLCGYTPSPPRKEIDKTALGATTTVPWEHFREPQTVITRLKSEGIPLYVLEQTDKSMPYYTLTRKNFPLCLVIGNEITGVSQEIISLADAAIDIPMFGMKQSLNVAVAAGIAMFDLVRIFKE
jgi:tRNA G18 (ribose-2'-O)-methylase SpoU